jgi:AhpD family alkylhydroperoxidase
VGGIDETDERTLAMHERMNPHKVAPELQKPMFALSKHISEHIDSTLFELVKLYASMLNGCGHCVDIHADDALKAGETTARLFGLSAWWEVPLYTPKERAALALTQAAR